ALTEEACKCQLKIKLPAWKKRPVGSLEVEEHDKNKSNSHDTTSDTATKPLSSKPKEHKRKHLKNAEQVPVKLAQHSKSQHQVSQPDPESDDGGEPPIPCRPRGRPPKSQESVVLHSSFSVAVYVKIAVHPVLQKGKTKRGDKMVKQDPKTFGPFTLMHMTKWKPFLKDLASTAWVDKENIPLDMMVWSMGGKKMLPLTNKAGFKAMQQQIKSAKDSNSVVIILYLPPIAHCQSKPDKKTKVDDSDDELNIHASEQLEVEEDDSLWGKKKSLDKQLAPVVEKLQNLYPVGNCNDHPGIRCFHYQKHHWHFDLDSNRMNVWAAAILKGETDYACAPLTSKFFSPKMRLNAEPEAQSAKPPAQLSVTHLLMAPPSPWGMNAYLFPYPTMTPYTPPPPPFFPFASPSAYTTPGPGAWGQPMAGNSFYGLQRQTHSPNTPTPMRLTILAAWCRQHGLGNEELEGLTKLGFRVGDSDLDDLDYWAWHEVGLGPLHKQRILRACAMPGAHHTS
ncbi:hypothetical protein DXG01_006953, partial [Tephrocybe rancida]